MSVSGPRLRVLEVCHGFPPDEQAGAELCSLFVSRELRARGHHVQVFARTGRANLAPYQSASEEAFGVEVLRLRTPTERAGSLRETYRDPRVREVFEAQLAVGYDVVHIHHLFGLSIDLIEAARAAGAVVAMTLHDFWFLCPRGQRFTPRGHLCDEVQPWRCSLCVAKKRVRWAMNGVQREWGRRGEHLRRPLAAVADAAKYLAGNLWRAPIHERHEEIMAQLNQLDLCFSPSQFVLDEYRRHGLTVTRAVHSENGMDVAWSERLAARDRPHRPLRFGFLGSFLPSKGIDLLLDAFAAVPAGVAELHLHGTSLWDGGEFHRRLERSCRHPDATFHGPFAHPRLAQILADLDVLVVPSRWYENAPLTLDEAALAGLPVVVADHGGLREITVRRGNGLRFRPGDASSLRACLLRFVNEEPLWAELSRSRVAVRSVADQVDELEAAFVAAVAARRGGGVDA